MKFIKKIAKTTQEARNPLKEKKLTLREKWDSWKEFIHIIEAIKVAAEKGESSCRIYIEYVVNIKRLETLGFWLRYFDKKEKPYGLEIDWDFEVEDYDDDDDWEYVEDEDF